MRFQLKLRGGYYLLINFDNFNKAQNLYVKFSEKEDILGFEVWGGTGYASINVKSDANLKWKYKLAGYCSFMRFTRN